MKSKISCWRFVSSLPMSIAWSAPMWGTRLIERVFGTVARPEDGLNAVQPGRRRAGAGYPSRHRTGADGEERDMSDEQRISYVPLEDMTPEMRAEMDRCAREGTPRP